MQFNLDGDEVVKFLKDKTDLFQRFTAEAGSTYNDAFIDFCSDTIDNEADEIHSIRIAFTYHDDIDCYYASVLEYQGIYFVRPSPEHDQIGYFFKKDEAIAAADQFASQVYDEYAEEEYERMLQFDN